MRWNLSLLIALIAFPAFAQTAYPTAEPATAPVPPPAVVPDVSAPPPPPVPPAPTVSAPLDAAPKAVPFPRLVFGETGFLEIHMLPQIWFLQAFDDREPYSPRLGSARSSFRIRRMEIKLAGEVTPFLAFAANFDPAKAYELQPTTLPVMNQNPPAVGGMPSEGVSVLQPFPGTKTSIVDYMYLTFRPWKGMNINIGEGKTPISADGPTPSGRLLFAERSELGRIFGDQKDLGAWVNQRFEHLAYWAGVYNGGPANTIDLDRKKDFVGRLELFGYAGVTLGLSAQRSLSDNSAGARTLAGGDLRLQQGPFIFQTEAYGREQFVPGGKRIRTASANAAALVTIGHLVGDWQPGVRFDWYDPDRSTKHDAYWRATAGINLYLYGPDVKLVLNYIHTQAYLKPAPDVPVQNANDDLLILHAQVAF
jgi:hypothetical protein